MDTAPDDVLARAGLFQGVAPEAREALASALQYHDYTRGETVFTEGEQGDSLFIVLTGKVKVGRRAADGRENMLSVMGPSDMFGELSLFDPGPRTATATVLTDARLASLAHSALRLRQLAKRVVVVHDAVFSPNRAHANGLARLERAGVELVSAKELVYDWVRSVEAIQSFKRENPQLASPPGFSL